MLLRFNCEFPPLQKEDQGGFSVIAIALALQIPLSPPFAKGEVPFGDGDKRVHF
jgi:hypothetical protein